MQPFFKQKFLRHLPVTLLAAGVLASSGCEKITQQEVKPSQTLIAGSVKQAAWQRFVDRIEQGLEVDPSGQYVAKGTVVSASKARTQRPKFDAAETVFTKHYALLVNGEYAGLSAGQPTGTASKYPPIDEDPTTGGGGGPSYSSSFASSENQGGPLAIHDLQLCKGGDSRCEARLAGAGYVKLNIDLNKGAGGSYIYLYFQRDPNGVIGDDWAKTDILSSITTKSSGWWDALYGTTTTPEQWYSSLKYQSQGNQGGPTELELNDGAGGAWIYSFQSKSSNAPYYGGPISEVGILSGNSSSIAPPAGWYKYPNDLNEGAGGDYIYFCYKH